jgi:hypothetical protein
MVDAADERDVVGPIIAAISRSRQRPQLGKARFPIAKDVLRTTDLVRKLPYGA